LNRPIPASFPSTDFRPVPNLLAIEATYVTSCSWRGPLNPCHMHLRSLASWLSYHQGRYRSLSTTDLFLAELSDVHSPWQRELPARRVSGRSFHLHALSLDASDKRPTPHFAPPRVSLFIYTSSFVFRTRRWARRTEGGQTNVTTVSTLYTIATRWRHSVAATPPTTRRVASTGKPSTTTYLSA